MRQILLITLLFIGFVTLEAQTLQNTAKDNGNGGAVLTFGDSGFDFGKIKEDGKPVSHDFEFTNTGDSPLVIIKVVTSCTCTKADFSKKPIAAGEKSSIKITYDPKKQSGVFYKAIQVYSNNKQGRVIITAKGEVIQ